MEFGFNEGAVRLAAFLCIFITMAIFELVSPRLERPELIGALKSKRWFVNLSMVVLSSLLLRIVFPAAAVGVAVLAEANGWGLFNILDIPPIVAFIAAFVILDFIIWLEHVVSHHIPLLWRIHRMHHVDTGFDVTTALRFHPLEIVLSMVWKGIIVVLIGAPVMAVLVFEIVLNGAAMFNHSNVKLPNKLDALLQKIIVTPDMHRIHHSVIQKETDSNFGFNFSLWDHLFNTYTAEPSAGRKGISFGLEEYREPNTVNLFWLLALPFKRK